MDREEEKEPAGRHTPNRDGSSSRNTSTATNTNNNSPTNSSPHGHSKSSKKSSSQTPTSGKKSSRSSPLGKSSPPSSRRSRRSTMSRAQEKETTVKEAIKEKPIETLNSDSAPSEPEPTKVIGNVVTNVGHQSHGATRAPALGNIGASFADSSSGLVPAAEDGTIPLNAPVLIRMSILAYVLLRIHRKGECLRRRRCRESRNIVSTPKGVEPPEQESSRARPDHVSFFPPFPRFDVSS